MYCSVHTIAPLHLLLLNMEHITSLSTTSKYVMLFNVMLLMHACMYMEYCYFICCIAGKFDGNLI